MPDMPSFEQFLGESAATPPVAAPVAAPYRIFTDGEDFAWLDDRDPADHRYRPDFYRARKLSDMPKEQRWVELLPDEVAAACVEANEGLGEALVAVNVALGLPPGAPARVTRVVAERMRLAASPHFTEIMFAIRAGTPESLRDDDVVRNQALSVEVALAGRSARIVRQVLGEDAVRPEPEAGVGS